MLEIGTIVDRYRVDCVIGTGGTAVVYKVTHESLGTCHALKVLSISNEIIRSRMLQEGRVQATLRHENVVAVTDVIDVNGDPGLLMEYIEGPSLQKAMRSYRLPLEAAEHLFVGIVAGVQVAHQRGLVHRDLKPANVLLFQTEAGFIPKVTDFGLAKVVAENGDSDEGHTRAGVAMGTPAYMCPEQIRDARMVDSRADVFSLGCILYELVLGQRAFPGDDAISIYNAIMSGNYQAPLDVNPDLPERIVHTIEGCLVLERDRRIQSCRAILQVLGGERDFELGPPQITFEEDPPTIETARPASPTAPIMQIAAPVDGGLETEDLGEEMSDGLSFYGAKLHEAASLEEDPLLATIGAAGAHVAPYQFPDPNPVDDSVLDPVTVHPEPPDEAAFALWTAFGLLMLFLAVMAGALTFYGKEVPSGESESLSTTAPPDQPAAVVPVGDEQRVDRSPSAAVVPAPAVVSSVGVTPESKPPPVRSKPIRKRVKKKPAPVPVVVKLTSVPPTASVRVDGESVGRTPKKLSLPPGTHVVHLESGAETLDFDVKVKAGQDNKWCFSFSDKRRYEGRCP